MSISIFALTKLLNIFVNNEIIFIMSQKKQNKELLILEAAEQEFLEKGYDGARTISIAQAAGVTHAMLHYYFRTKEKLFERIVDEKVHLMSQSLQAALGDASLPIVERIRYGIGLHFDFIASNPELPRFAINEIFSRPERCQMMHNRIDIIAKSLYTSIQHEIDKAAEHDERKKIDARMLLLSIISLNIFTFIATPFIKPIMGDLMSDRKRFLEARKRENIETIMCRIKP